MSIVNTLTLESNRKIKINFNGGDLSSDAGLLSIGCKARDEGFVAVSGCPNRGEANSLLLQVLARNTANRPMWSLQNPHPDSPDKTAPPTHLRIPGRSRALQ